MKIKKSFNFNILYSTIAWLIGFVLLFSIWSLVSIKKGTYFTLPSIFQSLSGFGKIIAGKSPGADGKEWAAIGISIGQALLCFLCASILAMAMAIATYYVRFLQYLFWPFTTLARAIPTAVIMAVVAAFIIQKTVWVLPIIISFFIIFPILYEAFNNAMLNISKFRAQIGKVYQVSKWNQFRKILLPSCAPYLYSACVACFGLSIKTVWASQVLAALFGSATKAISPNYPSVGKILTQLIQSLGAKPNNSTTCNAIVGWAIMAVLISLIVEIGLKYLTKLASPYRNKRFHIKPLW